MKKLLLTALVATFAMTSLPAYAVEGGEGHEGKKGAMAKYDVNGDGLLSKGEYNQRASDRFDAMDTNNDNQISKEEAKTHFKNRQAKVKERKENVKERRANKSVE